MRLSKEKKDRITEQILSVLYDNFPTALFIAEISRSLARDEEFIKKLLLDLKDKNLVISIKKNPKGLFYIRRSRWRLSNQTYEAYKRLHSNENI